MIRRIGLIMVILVALSAGTGLAQIYFSTGNDLYGEMMSDKPVARMWARGYVIGVADQCSVHANTAGIPNIVPKSSKITQAQIYDIVKLFLQNHPRSRHLPAATLVYQALQKTFAPRDKQ